MVRIADELVDGTATAAGANPAALLDAYEAHVLAAPEVRFHTDPVLHAYAATARRCGFDPEHIRAFFDSMRRDLTTTRYTPAEFDAYVYGSAEVIGLLCLAAFLVDDDPSPADRAEMEAGARALGSAFQKINFLRDLGEDRDHLGRAYFPLTDDAKDAMVASVRAELAQARAATALLPRTARAAVAAATALFTELTDMIDVVSATELAETRLSVPRHRKLALTARAVATGGRRA